MLMIVSEPSIRFEFVIIGIALVASFLGFIQVRRERRGSNDPAKLKRYRGGLVGAVAFLVLLIARLIVLYKV